MITLAVELLRIRSYDNYNDSECPFSEEFLNDLICAQRKQKNNDKLSYRPLSAPENCNETIPADTQTTSLRASRPSSAPDKSNETNPVDTQTTSLKQNQSDAVVGKEQRRCESSSIDFIEKNNQNSFYNLVRQSINNRTSFVNLEDDDGCPRQSSFDSLDMQADDTKIETPDKVEISEEEKIAMYDSMRATLCDLINV